MGKHLVTAAGDFTTQLMMIGDVGLVRLPEAVSRLLPSRGQVAVEAVVNGRAFRTVLEPDGLKGHWMRVDPALGLMPGAGVGVTLQVLEEWPEPDVPGDLASALAAAPAEVGRIWKEITSMARWEWVRWISATSAVGTRQRRVSVTISKLSAGKRRPCCFDRSACTDPAVASNGRLRGVSPLQPGNEEGASAQS